MASRGIRSGAKVRARRRFDVEGVLASPAPGARRAAAREGMLMRW